MSKLIPTYEDFKTYEADLENGYWKIGRIYVKKKSKTFYSIGILNHEDITSADTKSKAIKKARLLNKVYETGYYDGYD